MPHGAAISWASKKQIYVALCSDDAWYMALKKSPTIAVLWIKTLLVDPGHQLENIILCSVQLSLYAFPLFEHCITGHIPSRFLAWKHLWLVSSNSTSSVQRTVHFLFLL